MQKSWKLKPTFCNVNLPDFGCSSALRDAGESLCLGTCKKVGRGSPSLTLSTNLTLDASQPAKLLETVPALTHAQELGVEAYHLHCQITWLWMLLNPLRWWREPLLHPCRKVWSRSLTCTSSTFLTFEAPQPAEILEIVPTSINAKELEVKAYLLHCKLLT